MLTPEATAMLLETLARRIRNRGLTGPEAAATLDHEASLCRQTAAEDAEHRRTCPSCSLPEPLETLAMAG